MIDNVVCQLSHWKNLDEFNQLRNKKGEYSLNGFDRLQCIYIHIPKAAGISINKALFGNYGGGHRTVREYKRIFGPKLFNRYFTFTFVRNPYTRLLSAYRFLKNGGFNENDRKWAEENLSGYSTFDSFVNDWVNENNIWNYIHFNPQYSFVCDVGLDPEVDFIGKIETIDKDFNTVCDTLGIKNTLSTYNKGKSDYFDWRSCYSIKSLKKVAEIYRRDFELFDY